MSVSTTPRPSIGKPAAAHWMLNRAFRFGGPGRSTTTVEHRAGLTLHQALRVAAVATGIGLLILLAGTRFVPVHLSPWPRFWALTYFVLLIWPVGLTLVGMAAGRWAQVVVASLLLVATLGQQVTIGRIKQSPIDHWPVTLLVPGDAVRQKILLPADGDPVWERAWAQGTAAVAICSQEQVASEADLRISVDGRPAVPLASLPRVGTPRGVGWYQLPLSRAELPVRQIDVVVERYGAGGGPAILCGGRDDPTRPGAGGAWRRRAAGSWSAVDLANEPLPLVAGNPMLGRHYIELRFYDSFNLPRRGIYY